MPRVRKIERAPASGMNYFLVDACFLANKYIPEAKAPNSIESNRIHKCMAWWAEIDAQLKAFKCRVFVPDICIAETYKVLAKKYYVQGWFTTPVQMNNARNRARRDLCVSPRTLRSFRRQIRFHDIPTSRDIIISVDRFFEMFMKRGENVSLPDLVLLATGKYLIDFYDLQKERLHIITLDKPLWRGSKKIQELPNAYDPTATSDSVSRVFI